MANVQTGIRIRQLPNKSLNRCHLFISVINQLAQNFCFTISLFHASICFEHMYHHTYKCDDTRGCVMQF